MRAMDDRGLKKFDKRGLCLEGLPDIAARTMLHAVGWEGLGSV